MIGILAQHRVTFIPLCSYGRSGSSLLMKLLRAFGVTVEGDLPFEDRTIQVGFLDWLAEGTEAAERPELWCLRFLGIEYFSNILSGVGNRGEMRKRLAQYCAATGHQGAIAEKAIGLEVLCLMKGWDLHSSIKPIYLVRDPRDTFISVKEFNAKRQTQGFNDSGDDRRLFESVCGYGISQIRAYERTGGTIVYYEDLVYRRPQTAVQLLRHIGRAQALISEVEAAFRVSQPDDQSTRAHMTSATPESSVGRWKTGEASRYAAMFEERASAINLMGYAS